MIALCYTILSLAMNLGKAMSRPVYFCFSKQGETLAHSISEGMPGKVVRVKGLHDCVKREFKPGARLLFIGALGICVRGIAPFIEAKTSDPAEVVMDEMGRFVIPVLSGHLVGANDWALELAKHTGATRSDHSHGYKPSFAGTPMPEQRCLNSFTLSKLK